jgi:hypothetical protein
LEGANKPWLGTYLQIKSSSGVVWEQSWKTKFQVSTTPDALYDYAHLSGPWSTVSPLGNQTALSHHIHADIEHIKAHSMSPIFVIVYR